MATMKGPPGRMMGGRRIGPPPSMPAYKREPVDEQVPARGPGPTSKIKTLAPVKTALTPRPVGVPDQARAAKGLTLMGMLRKQPRYIVNSGDDVVVRSFKKTKTKGGMPAITGVTRDITTKPVSLHRFQIIGTDPAKPDISTQKKIKVSCDCGFFMYYCEYALWTWGAANIRFSNGQPATIRNPGNHPIVCKHVAKLLQVIKQRND